LLHIANRKEKTNNQKKQRKEKDKKMLLGGSQADTNRTYTHGFFHEGVKSTQFRVSSNYFIRILPAFDFDKQNTPQFNESYVPYRSSELGEDELTKTPGFTAWFFVVQGYSFYGKSNHTFLSPLSALERYEKRAGKDPIRDIRDFCEKSDDPTIRALSEDKSFKERAPAQLTRTYVMCNVLNMTDLQTKETQNQVGIFTNAAWKDLKQKLALYRPANDEIISSEFEDFLYGDITHPKEGLAANVKETEYQNIRFSGLHFSDRQGRLGGHQVWDVTETTPNAIKDRYNISDTDNVTKIATYDEVLDIVVKDGVVPYDIIERACGPYAENGIPNATATSVGPSHSIPKQVSEAEPASEPATVVAAVGTVTPPSSSVTAAAVQTEAAEEVKEEVSESADSDTSAVVSNGQLNADELRRYADLSGRFKEDASKVSAEELPEFFDLCARLGVSPGK
jgi:hypothetical protein